MRQQLALFINTQGASRFLRLTSRHPSKGAGMKTVIEMAREAGFNPVKYMGSNLELFIRLVELARANEREACAKVAEQRSEPGTAAFIRARGQA